MKQQTKTGKKADPTIDNREKGFNVYFQGANKTLAEEMNFKKKQEENTLKRYQSKTKNTNDQRGSISSNQAPILSTNQNKWTSIGRPSNGGSKTPPTLNNRIKEVDMFRERAMLRENTELTDARNKLKQSLNEYKANPNDATYKQLINNVT